MARLKNYKLEELMDECDLTLPSSAEEETWLEMAPVGLEVGIPDSAESDAAAAVDDMQSFIKSHKLGAGVDIKALVTDGRA